MSLDLDSGVEIRKLSNEHRGNSEEYKIKIPLILFSSRKSSRHPGRNHPAHIDISQSPLPAPIDRQTENKEPNQPE